MPALPESRQVLIRRRPLLVAAHHYPKWWDMVEANTWEPALFAAFDKFIQPESTVIDVGGWIGCTPLYCAHLASKVYAFEPDASALKILRLNFALNPQLASRITLFEAGLGTVDGQVALFNHAPGNSGSSLLSFDAAHSDLPACDTITLLDARRFLAMIDMKRVSLIKIDIEGAEYDLIDAIAPLLQEYRPTLILSLHPLKLGGQGSVIEDRFYRLARSVSLCQALAHYPYIFHETNGALARRNDKAHLLDELKAKGFIDGCYTFSYQSGW
ncbi:MAG: FkbM family methyltransferase [Magnetococcales bacterium]|nr:FkbM family methyltransferase [Magnetococcales bacterium]MBF0114083.1 FkbM family methyltransferase [Magnetococcales bacterium]